VDKAMEPDQPAQAPNDAAQQRWLVLLAEPWHRLVLAKPTTAAGDLQRVQARPLRLKGEDCISLVYSHATRDVTQNLPRAEALALVKSLLGSQFRNAHLFTADAETQLLLSKKGKGHISQQPLPSGAAATTAPDAGVHDRSKRRWVDQTSAWLTALGVTTAAHQVVPAMARKWKQINRFVEIVSQAIESAGLASQRGLRVVDFGAGKAYLTFAVHDWLQAQGLAPDVVGVELRPDLVAQGNQVVEQLGLTGLRLEPGDVHQWNRNADRSMDVMIALHACDTATDQALYLGITAGARVIVCSPCCHKQLRPQLLSPHPLKSVFQHGIHAEQQAEMLTDSLRALLLQAEGYDTQVFEFVSLEHTAKNKMILATKRRRPLPREPVLQQVAELKGFFGIREQALEALLTARGERPGPLSG
jgi:hypothetical protein